MNKNYNVVEKFLKTADPNESLASLSRKLFLENPKTFTGTEHARSYLRSFLNLPGKEKKILSIPDGKKEDNSIYEIKTAKLAILNDIHFPYHNKKALSKAIQKCIDEKVTAILLNGDVLDFYQLSVHVKEKNKPSLNTEVQITKKFFKDLRKLFPNIPIYFKLGNHEIRLEKYIQSKAKELEDLDVLKIENLLDFEKFNIIKINKYTPVKIEDLIILHGHEYPGSGGDNPAKNIYNKTKHSVLCGHFHRESSYKLKDITGKSINCYSVGCLCDLSPNYLPFNNWVNGFAIVTTEKNKTKVDNIIL
jgi:predicted phosphodiesterase